MFSNATHAMQLKRLITLYLTMTIRQLQEDVSMSNKRGIAAD